MGICILYAGRICNGRDRIHQSKECRKYYYEEPDGFLYRNLCYLSLGFGILLGEDALGGFIGTPTLGIFTDYANFDWSNFVFNLSVLCNNGNNRIRSNGRTNKILILLYLFSCDFR